MLKSSQGRIYLDVSETLSNRLNTGIQRVVRNIANRTASIEKATGRKCNLVYARSGNFYILRNNEQINNAISFLNEINDDSPSRFKTNPLISFIKERKITRIVYPKLLKFVSSLKAIAREGIKKLKLLVQELFYKVKFNKNDALVLIDSFWSHPAVFESTLMARSRNTAIVVLIYDLIPLDYPEYVEKHNRINFRDMIFKFFDLSDGVLTISNYCKGRIEALLRQNKRRELSEKVGYFHLGSDFEKTKNFVSGAEFNAELDFTLAESGETIFLMVGTIEPRKGHLFVLKAFHEYWELGGEAKLLIVGKFGWMYEEIESLMTESHYFKKQLFHLDKVSDSLLAELYHRSSALIMASYVEGFGLPIVEAIQYGKPVLASKIPVFEEIAKDFPLYFSLSDTETLVRLLQTDVRDIQAHAENKKLGVWPSWDMTVSVFIERLSHILKSRDLQLQAKGDS